VPACLAAACLAVEQSQFRSQARGSTNLAIDTEAAHGRQHPLAGHGPKISPTLVPEEPP